MRSSRSSIFWLIPFLSMILPSGSSAEIPTSVVEKAAKAVVLVEARDCQGDTPSRNGTGFSYGDTHNVVTAYHVVAGCAKIELWYEYAGGQPFRETKVARVLARNDLALLHVDKPANDTFLTAAGAMDHDKDFKALGYGEGSPSMGDLDLRVSFGSARLGDMLPSENMQDIANTSIDSGQQVIRFSRPLLPGMSGGPIFDENGKIIAVVAGGLKSGAVPSSWGWPAAHIADLLQSNEALSGNVRISRTTFAFSVDRQTAESVKCGGLEFQKRDSLSFAEAAASSDDIARLYGTASVSGVPQQDVQAFRFQTWVHRESGATVVVPEDVQLVADDDTCVAQSDDGTFEQVIKAEPATTPAEIQQVSVDFENTVMQPSALPNIGWYADNVLMQGLPRTRPDGLVINRKAFFIGKQQLGPGHVRAIHQFETIMARGGSFVGIAMINNNVDQCFNAFNVPSLCTVNPAYIREWARFVLATQLSTYPIY